MESSEDAHSEFDEIALSYRRRRKDRPGGARRQKEKLGVLLRRLPAERKLALEIGCGIGSFARVLADRFDQVLAIDTSPEMIRFAREESADHANLTFEVRDVMAWDIPDRQFDCIALRNALHHLPAAALLAKLKPALRPGGMLLIYDCYLPENVPWAQRAWIRTRKSISQFIRVVLLRRKPWRKGERPVPILAHTHDRPFITVRELKELRSTLLPGAEIQVDYMKNMYTLIWRTAGMHRL